MWCRFPCSSRLGNDKWLQVETWRVRTLLWRRAAPAPPSKATRACLDRSGESRMLGWVGSWLFDLKVELLVAGMLVLRRTPSPQGISVAEASCMIMGRNGEGFLRSTWSSAFAAIQALWLYTRPCLLARWSFAFTWNADARRRRGFLCGAAGDVTAVSPACVGPPPLLGWRLRDGAPHAPH